MKKCVKHFAQILYSILSAVSATAAFYLISGLTLRNSTQDTWLTVLDIITAILALIFNLLFGLRFCGKLTKAGYIIQFAFLLAITAVSVYFEGTYWVYICMLLNPVYSFAKDAICSINTAANNSAALDAVLALASSALPGLFMFLGSKAAKKKA